MGCQQSKQITFPENVQNIEAPSTQKTQEPIQYALDPKQNDWRMLTSGSKFGLIQRIKATVKTPRGWRRLMMDEAKQCQKDIDRITDESSIVAFDRGAYYRRQFKDVVKPTQLADKFIVRVLPARSPEKK